MKADGGLGKSMKEQQCLLPLKTQSAWKTVKKSVGISGL